MPDFLVRGDATHARFTWNLPTSSGRPPEYGLPLLRRHAVLNEVLPFGLSRWVGLYEIMPTANGVGGLESTFARVLHQTWESQTIDDIAQRVNTGTISFGPSAGATSITGWGVWSASVGGTLLAFGPFRNAQGEETTLVIPNGVSPRFQSGSLVVGIQ